MNKSLKIALVHPAIRYGEPEINRADLLRLNYEAARRGADIIFNTELAVSGYSFDSREDISRYAESHRGETVKGLTRIARAHGKYIGIGLAEADETTGEYHNSAFMISPNGRLVCKYRKVSAELRWASPGNAKQRNTFNTPWGRMGVLICSDTYYGLLPRSTALKGVNLLWVPANWPPGGIDPQELWRARALENGFFVAACNRSGLDRKMDCRNAVSCVYSPRGSELFSESSEASRIFFVDIPLDENGKLDATARCDNLKRRTPRRYGPIHLDLSHVDDLTSYYGLGEPGPLHVHCVIPEKQPLRIEYLERVILDCRGNSSSLFVLPALPLSDKALLSALAKRHRVGLCATLIKGGHRRAYTFWNGNGKHPEEGTQNGRMRDRFPFPMVLCGPAKIAMASFDSFTHPELAVTFAKLGCDLAVLSEEEMESDSRLLSGIKTIENLAVAVCTSNGGMIAMVPEGHHRWEERGITGAGVCSFDIDIKRTRKKRFQDRVDYALLLRNSKKCGG